MKIARAARRRLTLLLAPLLLLGYGCGDDDTPTGPSALMGRVWKLESLRKPGGSVEAVDREQYTVEFRDGGLLAARADCNVCTGSYRAASTVITIEPLACTRVFCGEDSLGDDYTAILGSARVYAEEGETLVLLSNSGTLRYRP